MSVKKINKPTSRWEEEIAKNWSTVFHSNLPLLLSNGRPRSLETISQVELEAFVSFMILCSVGKELEKPRRLSDLPPPEWWPEKIPFRFPLPEDLDGPDAPDRHVQLKSLVCRCYTFYDSQFLLKFSSELAEMSPHNLVFQGHDEENSTYIYDGAGSLLAIVRNDNLNYDEDKKGKRYLSPKHCLNFSQGKRFAPVVDLTFETSSEDEKEVYFKEKQSEPPKRSCKRRVTFDPLDVVPKKQAKRKFDDYVEEVSPPKELTKEQFLEGHGLLKKGTEEEFLKKATEITLQTTKDKKRKIKKEGLVLLSITTTRSQELIKNSRYLVKNVDQYLAKVEKHCGTSASLVDESSRTHNTTDLPANKPRKDLKRQQGDWSHTYKWPLKTRNPKYPYCGPTIKPCEVQLVRLSESMILKLMTNKWDAGTMTPVEWSKDGENQPSCSCRVIPLIDLENDAPGLRADKGTSTRCACAHRLAMTSGTRKPLATVDDASASLPVTTMKNQYYRSTSDAVKWYSEKNPVLEPIDLEMECNRNESILSREKVKPKIDFLIPNPQKPVSYFPAHLIVDLESDRDYCYERMPFETLRSPKLATRRGQRHYLNREPCPSCFHGRDFLCVYEYVRQAKFIGVDILRDRIKLQSFFFNYLMKFNSKC